MNPSIPSDPACPNRRSIRSGPDQVRRWSPSSNGRVESRARSSSARRPSFHLRVASIRCSSSIDFCSGTSARDCRIGPRTSLGIRSRAPLGPTATLQLPVPWADIRTCLLTGVRAQAAVPRQAEGPLFSVRTIIGVRRLLNQGLLSGRASRPAMDAVPRSSACPFSWSHRL